MNIEFHTPQGQVKKWVLDSVKQKLLELYQKDKEISRAQVYFRDQDGRKICEVQLTIYGASLIVHRRASTFEQASREVLSELEDRINEQIRNQNELPDQYTSSVKV